MTDVLRKPHRWKVTLQADNGEVGDVELEAHWDPNHKGDGAHDGTEEAVGRAAAVQAWWASRQTRRYSPISVELVA